MVEYIEREAMKRALRNAHLHLDEAGIVIEIDDIPSADVQPVKHGRWIEYPECLRYENAFSSDHIVCSCCEAVFNVLDNCTECFVCCPNCGAKMSSS